MTKFGIAEADAWDSLGLEDRQKDAHLPYATVAIANKISSFCFQWIPTYRVYATGQPFWNIRRLEDTTWGRFIREGDLKEAKPREAPPKAKL